MECGWKNEYDFQSDNHHLLIKKFFFNLTKNVRFEFSPEHVKKIQPQKTLMVHVIKKYNLYV